MSRGKKNNDVAVYDFGIYLLCLVFLYIGGEMATEGRASSFTRL